MLSAMLDISTPLIELRVHSGVAGSGFEDGSKVIRKMVGRWLEDCANCQLWRYPRTANRFQIFLDTFSRDSGSFLNGMWRLLAELHRAIAGRESSEAWGPTLRIRAPRRIIAYSFSHPAVDLVAIPTR